MLFKMPSYFLLSEMFISTQDAHVFCVTCICQSALMHNQSMLSSHLAKMAAYNTQRGGRGKDGCRLNNFPSYVF